MCPSCDVAPPSTAKAGDACAGCGARLVVASSTDPLVGTVLDGRFAIRERLGSGAMGIVYRASQLSIGRDVAVKVLAGIDNPERVKRFFREAKIASTLSHPNTVQIIDFGQGADGRVYIAMELVRGRTLLQELAEGAMPSRRICRIGSQLCEALDAAHRLSIVHRDLKLENVMITDDGTDHVKILDFGIARLLNDATTQVTGVGLVAGTPNYMAPEVLGNLAAPAPPQDMYALGVMLGELALGETLWAPTSLEMLLVEKTQNDAVDRVPPRLRPIVRKLVDPEPSGRPTAAEARRMLRELDRIATDPVGVAATLPPELGLGKLELVEIDQRGGARGAPASAEPGPASPAPPPSLEPATAPAPSNADAPDVFAAPAAADAPLELDRAWQAERASRGAGAASPAARRFMREQPPAPAPRRRGGALVLVVLLACALGGGAYYYVSSQDKPQAPAASAIGADRGISIRVIGPPGTPVTIDGKPAGKVPLSLKRTRSKRALVIAGPSVEHRVIPDRDQTIDLSTR